MLFSAGVVILLVLVLLAVIGAVHPLLLLLASVIVSHFCLRDISGWLIAAALIAVYVVIAFLWGAIDLAIDRLRSGKAHDSQVGRAPPP